MIRFLFRLLAMVALTVSVIMAVLDAARSVAVSALVTTPLAVSWASVSPETLASAQQAVAENLNPLAWDLVAANVLALPGFVVFAALALLFYAIGRRPERQSGRLAV
ncbi:hypothetical protein RB623_11210 [Mesorhizobium sp. LHD-90]|uniref:hypothetical protein n=1 Tax=Mesorhizobium sp. LHD-90 TaxID=3071414 RepID=UPI0027E1072B|nr:hypothetical protein [Mesorhizobium sp. LHD-90]MDQ6434613.1 hypothetical protein [Mesorhizobium sp. LHD-90]